MAVHTLESTAVPVRKRTQNAASNPSIWYIFNANCHAKCDSCRRKKAKCSGKLPCHTCSSLRLECSYRPKVWSSRGTVYAVHSERNIVPPEAQAACKTEPENPDSPISNGEQRSETLPVIGIPTPESRRMDTASATPSPRTQPSVTPSDSSTLQSRTIPDDTDFIETYSTTSRRVTAEAKQCAYGSWGGIEIVRQMRADLDRMVRIPPPHSLAFLLTSALDQPHPLKSLPIAPADGLFSPAKESLISRVGNAFNGVLAFWPFLEKSAIVEAIEWVYDPKSTGRMVGHDDMALVYAVAALGESFENSFVWDVGVSLAGVRWEGLDFFQTAQRMVDPGDCARSLTAVQVIMTTAIFLISRSSITAAHRLISNAANGALQLGLHQRFYPKSFSETEMRQRQRTFQSLRALDTHICHFLGLPTCLPVARGGYKSWPEEWFRHLDLDVKDDAEGLVTDNLFNILASTQQKAYSSGLKLSCSGAHRVPINVFQEYARNFDSWKDLQRHFYTKGFLKDMSASNLAETTAEMMVLSPFLHYAFRTPSIVVRDGYTAGMRCVKAATRHIGIIEQLPHEKLPVAGCFSLTFGLVFAATALLMMEVAGGTEPIIEEIQKTNIIAQRVLQRLSFRSEVIFACYESLQPIYKITNNFG